MQTAIQLKDAKSLDTSRRRYTKVLVDALHRERKLYADTLQLVKVVIRLKDDQASDDDIDWETTEAVTQLAIHYLSEEGSQPERELQQQVGPQAIFKGQWSIRLKLSFD